MSTTATRKVQIVFSEDVVGTQNKEAIDNIVSPGSVSLVDLTTGANTVTVPTAGNAVATAVTITPPAGNTTLITLKGVAGDTGIPLHPTDPSSIALDPSAVSFVLSAADDVAGVQLIWS